MDIYLVQDENTPPAFSAFLDTISDKLAAAIEKKLLTYREFNNIYNCSSLKILNPRIWGYKGTIYKLRVDCGKESARILFSKTQESNIVVLHGFIKKTRKTPKKEAQKAMHNYACLKKNGAVVKFPFRQVLPTPGKGNTSNS